MDLGCSYPPLATDPTEVRRLDALNGTVVTVVDGDGISTAVLYVPTDLLGSVPHAYREDEFLDYLDMDARGADEEREAFRVARREKFELQNAARLTAEWRRQQRRL